MGKVVGLVFRKSTKGSKESVVAAKTVAEVKDAKKPEVAPDETATKAKGSKESVEPEADA